jgi:hypothetical protein
MGLFRKSKKTEDKDTGLRGTYEGRLYVDKTVFYKRPEVQEAIQQLKNSMVVKEQIKISKG